MIRDYKLPFETLLNLPVSRQKNKFEKLFTEFNLYKILTGTGIKFRIALLKKLFSITPTKTYKTVNISEIRIDRMGSFL